MALWNKISKEKESKIIELYKKGHSRNYIGKTCNIYHNTVSTVIKRNNIPRRKKELTTKYQDLIIELYKEGRSTCEIADKHNISQGFVTKILNNNNIKRRTHSEATRKYSLNENYFEVIDTEEKAYWLGFIVADGNIFKNRLRIGLQKKDNIHLQKFLNDLNATHRVNYGYSIKNGKKHNFCGIEISSNNIKNDLNKYGVVPRKGKIVKPYNLRKDLQRHYWRGLIDGDGSITKNKKGNWYLHLSGNQYIVKGFSKYIKERFKTRAIAHEYNTVWSFRSGGNRLVKKIITHFYKDANIYLDRKMELAKQIFEE